MYKFPQVQNRCYACIVWATKLLLENGFTTLNYVIRELLKALNRNLVMFNLELAVMPNTSWKLFFKKNKKSEASSIHCTLWSGLGFFFLWGCLLSTCIFRCVVRESTTHSPMSRSGGSLTPTDPDRSKSVSCFPALHRHVLGNAWKYSFVCLCLWKL